jgi:glycerol-1-phosphate dehydrogenase [NAD(P)+]
MDFPRTVLIGHGVTDQIADVCRYLQFGNNGMMITGPETYKAAGRRIEDIMSGKYDMLTILTGNANYANLDDVSRAAKEHSASFLLAVGGGSKIDIAKMTAKDLGIPFISIPTSVSHDGIASDRASLKSDGGSRSVVAVSPTGIIADTEVINNAPFRYLAAGCADVISNLTALGDWDFANRIAGETISSSAYAISKYAAEDIISNSKLIKPRMEEGVWTVMRPVIASGVSMCIAGSSRPTSGSEHMFSHALDVIRPDTALHGEQCGLGAVMMMELQGGNWKMIRDALKNIGAPTTAKELGFADEDIIEALMRAKDIRRERFTILGDRGLTREAAEKVAAVTGVI